MAKVDYKKIYLNLPGKPFERVKTIMSKHYGKWELDDYEPMVLDVLAKPSTTVGDLLDVMGLIVDQQAGNAQLKRAFFVLTAEVAKSQQRGVQQPKEASIEVVDDVVETDEE